MKYGDLVTPNVMNKLMAYSFKRDGVDIAIYRFSKSIEEVFGFMDSQRRKIIERYAEVSEGGIVTYASESSRQCCSDEVIEMLRKDVEIDLPEIKLREDDFEPENHQRPSQKEAWITPMEIRAILALSEKQLQGAVANLVSEN